MLLIIRSKHLEITLLFDIMKFITACVITAGKTSTIGFPLMTKKSLIPSKITITEIINGEEVSVTGVLCRIHAGGAEVGNYGEPTFRLTNELDLANYKGIVERAGRVSITITNRSAEPKRLKLYTDYTKSYGGVLLEEKIDHFENLLNDIHSKGFCTRLVISFNKDVEHFEFASVSEYEPDENDQTKWIVPFDIPIDNELDVDEQVYTIDFTGPDLGIDYSENLNFLEIRAIPKKRENDRDPFNMYVTAYGFPYQH